MPTVEFRGRRIDCEEGAALRRVLLDAGLSPHNGVTGRLNCRGHGSCGTCAVQVDGETDEPGRLERLRLGTPPHHPNHDLRLACQTEVRGDLVVRKYPGKWGQHLDREPLPDVDGSEGAAATDGGPAAPPTGRDDGDGTDAGGDGTDPGSGTGTEPGTEAGPEPGAGAGTGN